MQIGNSSQHKTDWRLALTVSLIALAIVASTILSHGSPVVLRKSLSEFPRTLDGWRAAGDEPLDAETAELLAATDVLNRTYADPRNRRAMGVFVAFFSNQRKGGAVHSPKNCLPGSGWDPVSSETVELTIPGSGKRVKVNQYIIQNGAKKNVVLYWYQSQGRIIASEYTAKICLIWDAVRRNRTDGSLVRLIAPIVDGNEQASIEQVKTFAQNSFPVLQEFLPD